MTLLAQLAALLAIVSTGVVYGTDAFCALVQRPALARFDDTTLTAIMGNVHRYGDRRMPAPGIVGIIAAAAASVIAAVAGHTAESVNAGVAFLLLVGWVVLYLRISAHLLLSGLDVLNAMRDHRHDRMDRLPLVFRAHRHDLRREDPNLRHCRRRVTMTGLPTSKTPDLLATVPGAVGFRQSHVEGSADQPSPGFIPRSTSFRHAAYQRSGFPG
jgi:hypothetical protein